jgi:alanyl-tRNA synthetase
MKNHTATHVIGGAARRVLGMHVWQYGTQKGVESSRLDISHYRRLTLEEIQKIEILANQAVERNIPVETTWLPRNEAESCYGFRLYQGGAIPGKEIRVVRSGDWDVEACAGTHVRNTGEIEFIKITHSERVQDGVERLTYSVGIPGVKALQKNEELLLRVAEMLNAPLDKLDKTVEKLSKELKEANAEKRRLLQKLAEHESGESRREQSERIEEIGGVRIVKRDFGEEIDVDRMVKTASELVKHDGSTIALFYGADQRNARILVMVGDEANKRGIEAGSAVREGSAVLGGGGGGRPNFAQGGGTKVAQIQQAVEKAVEALKTQLVKGKA